jgi:hypothetical protein
MDPDQKLLLERPIEEDTRIVITHFLRVDGIPILQEIWRFDGLWGISAVFLTQSVSGMDDAALCQFLAQQAGVHLSADTTITRGKIHTFVNYGFKILE